MTLYRERCVCGAEYAVDLIKAGDFPLLVGDKEPAVMVEWRQRHRAECAELAKAMPQVVSGGSGPPYAMEKTGKKAGEMHEYPMGFYPVGPFRLITCARAGLSAYEVIGATDVVRPGRTDTWSLSKNAGENPKPCSYHAGRCDWWFEC